MPIFEYRCECGHAFEQLVRPSTEPACPQCGSARIDKQLSVFATTSSSGGDLPLPAGCGSCGHPDGPGACQFH